MENRLRQWDGRQEWQQGAWLGPLQGSRQGMLVAWAGGGGEGGGDSNISGGGGVGGSTIISDSSKSRSNL